MEASSTQVPEFVERKLFVDMTDEEQEEFLTKIRNDRMVLIVVHQKTQRMKNAVKNETLQLKIEKLGTKIEKVIEKIDAELEKVQLLNSQVRGLRIQAIALEEDVE